MSGLRFYFVFVLAAMLAAIDSCKSSCMLYHKT